MSLPYKNPQGYRQLRTWQQANEILELTEEFIKTLLAKAPERGHMDRSARSTVRNIEEGFRRTTTQEYINFLGFSAGSNEELMADFEHCLKGKKGDQKRAEKGYWLCKGEGSMLHSQIKSLEEKMIRERTLPESQRIKSIMSKRKQVNSEFDQYLGKIRRGETPGPFDSTLN